MDLRERAMVRLEKGESVRRVAEALDVAPSSVVKWSQRLQVTGIFSSSRPAAPGGKFHGPVVSRGSVHGQMDLAACAGGRYRFKPAGDRVGLERHAFWTATRHHRGT